MTYGKVLKVKAAKVQYNNKFFVEFSPKKGGKVGGMRFAQKYFNFTEDDTFVS